MLTVSADPNAQSSDSILPITYSNFPDMCHAGDTLFVGRYLVNGADQSSLYLQARLSQTSFIIA